MFGGDLGLSVWGIKGLGFRELEGAPSKRRAHERFMG